MHSDEEIAVARLVNDELYWRGLSNRYIVRLDRAREVRAVLIDPIGFTLVDLAESGAFVAAKTVHCKSCQEPILHREPVFFAGGRWTRLLCKGCHSGAKSRPPVAKKDRYRNPKTRARRAKTFDIVMHLKRKRNGNNNV
jgi:hypothetical protein